MHIIQYSPPQSGKPGTLTYWTIACSRMTGNDLTMPLNRWHYVTPVDYMLDAGKRKGYQVHERCRDACSLREAAKQFLRPVQL